MRNQNKNKQHILILSSEFDQSTSDVIEWLLIKNKSVIRLNYTVGVDIKAASINEKLIDVAFNYKERLITTNSIKSFWYRRGKLIANKYLESDINPQIKWYLNEEKIATLDFLVSELNKKAKINYVSNGELNKLLQLTVALNCKLKIPNTYLTSCIDQTKEYINKNSPVITKSIQVPFGVHDEKRGYSLMTSKFDLADLEKALPSFPITKFQKQIQKQYELRIFYLNREFYPMAIFSQSNSTTEVDFRNYDRVKPNRKVPYILPDEIKRKLKKLMTKLDLLSGSIDMIVDTNNDYYFLEVNPVGQFGMVSIPCNYYLEEKIANLLC